MSVSQHVYQTVKAERDRLHRELHITEQSLLDEQAAGELAHAMAEPAHKFAQTWLDMAAGSEADLLNMCEVLHELLDEHKRQRPGPETMTARRNREG